ncbi:MAG: hypothetical protein IJO45_01565, partial [Oscillospiraceae bacterium]|nr:hypothetical protein [Oscillospiraceae bacterium]
AYSYFHQNETDPGLGDNIIELSTSVSTENGQVSQAATFGNEEVSAQVPAGVQVESNTLTLTVSEKSESESGIALEAGQEILPLDIHIEGVSAENATPIQVCLGKILPNGLNIGNVTLYHVEDGVANEMIRVMTLAELDEHNEFYYDPATGDITVAMASFSEVAMVSEEPAWEGKRDYTWYNTTDDVFEIANADQLAGLSAIVGGMDNQTQDSFSGKTIKLIGDINIGDLDSENGIVFYPIGYNSDDGKYEKTGVAVSTGFYSFEGTFDGQGHTISNFYQNTWEMKGDHDWYDANLQYYRDGMGLFGKVYGGTVRNLTVENFSSDGEIATTGTIAAYAEGATFENIAIFNCNPRVYNIGNGGIVGCVGWYAKEANLKTTFTNITVDNSNKISALWGSYDVACGGIVGQYYPTSGQSSADYPVNGGIHMENCHVAAQMDVFNDVCANYQYYAYRYAGMLIGSIRENLPADANGHVYPNMNGITASGCTVHYGDWNDYYYCELVANSLASYTHDHQFSRLDQVASVDVEKMTVTSLDGKTTAIPTSGRYNYVVVNGTHATENATCYHFVDGKVHNHDDYNGDGTPDKETVDGQEIFVENNRHIYLEFNNLVTGYGWGVTSKGVGDMEGVKILDREDGSSVEKFKSLVAENSSYTTGTSVTIGELFAAVDQNVDPIEGANVQVAVSPVGETSTAGGTYTADAEDWVSGTLTFSGTGAATITITDYNFCTPTTINVEIVDLQPVVKFEKLFTNTNFTYRIGNENAVKLSSLFEAKSGAEIGTVAVTIENVAGNASGAYTSNATWGEGTIQFSGTGKVTVSITDNDYCIPTELTLEVVDATNATGAANATTKDIVLLKNGSFSSLEVSNGHTLYGNGFTLTCGSDSYAADLGYSFVTLADGTLDNVQIVCPNFDYAALYKSNLTSSSNRSYTDTSGKTRYYNARSGVMVSGNSQILNSRISGARAAVNVSSGNVVIDNSRIELGAVANILVGSANSLTLRDVTLVQKPAESTYKADGAENGTTIMGFSVLYMCDDSGNAAPTTLEGTLIQDAWIDENDANYVPSEGQSIITAVMKQTDYLHDLNNDGTKESLNLGFAYMPAEPGNTMKDPGNITDERTDKNTIPYETVKISASLSTFYVCSYTNKQGTAASFVNVADYSSNKYSDIIKVAYSDTADGLTTGKSFDANGWTYELNVDLDKLSGYALDFSKLAMTVNGESVTEYLVDGSTKPTTPVVVTAGGKTYVLSATVDGKEYAVNYKVTGTETSKESPSLVASNYEAGVCVASSYGGTWSGAAPALKGIQIRYWSVAEKQYKTINLADYTPTTKGQLNGTSTTWTYTPDNGDFILTLTGGQVHSSNNVYAMPVCVDTDKDDTADTLYFVAATSNGLVNTGNGARTIPVSYSFKDNNNGQELKFSYTWSVAEDKNAQYKYSDFCNGTWTQLEETCLVEGTLITMADGTQKAIENVTVGDMVLAFNHVSGKFEAMPIIFNTHTDQEASEYDVLHLELANGEELKIVQSHGLFDMTLMKYVYVDYENYADFIGHEFYYAGNDGTSAENVVLENAYIATETVRIFCPVSYFHMNSISNGFLNTPNIPGNITGLVNYFEYDPDLKYNEEAMQRDIETYGLYSYEDFSDYISEEAYNSSPSVYLKVAVGKGMITYEQIIDVIEYLLAGSLIDSQ